MTHLIRLSDYSQRIPRTAPHTLFFTRSELMMLIGWYSMAVARGEWRDYALDHLEDAAVFSVFRHAHEQPLFSIVKSARSHRKGVLFSLYRGSQRLDHRSSLTDLITRIREKPRLVSDT